MDLSTLQPLHRRRLDSRHRWRCGGQHEAWPEEDLHRSVRP